MKKPAMRLQNRQDKINLMDLVLPVEEQIDIIYDLCKKRSYPLAEVVFFKAKDFAREISEQISDSEVLIVFPKLGTPYKTFNESMRVLSDGFDRNPDVLSTLVSNKDNMLFCGGTHEIGLYFSVVDLLANYENPVNVIRHTTPGTESLMRFSGFWLGKFGPELLKKFNRIDYPEILFSGIQIKRNFNGLNDFNHAIGMRYDRKSEQIKLDTHSVLHSQRKTCVPAVRRCVGILN